MTANPTPRKTLAPRPRVILGIETATPHGGAALATTEGRLIAHRWAFAGTGYSRRLLSAIDALLVENGLTKADLVAIAVTRGPGSFTGVRVGLTAAKTLAHFLGLPLYLFSTLQCVASRWPAEGTTAVLLDARRSEIYSAAYDRAEGAADPHEVRPGHVGSCADFLESLARLSGDTVWMTGDAVEIYRDQIKDRMGARARFVPAPWNMPAADSVALAGARALAAGRPPTDPMEAAPDYLRASDAERGLAKETP